MVHFRVYKTFIIGEESFTDNSDNFIIFIFAFREKNGLLRNDFLDCMIKLKHAGKNEGQGGVQSTDNPNTGDMMGKLKQHFML